MKVDTKRFESGSISRLLPSDLIWLRSELGSQEVTKRVADLFADFLESLTAPSASELDDVDRISAQLNTADFWESYSPGLFVDHIKHRVHSDVLDALLLSLDVKLQHNQDTMEVKGIPAQNKLDPDPFSPVVKGKLDRTNDPAHVPGVIHGTVKFYSDKKGFGFIQPDDGTKDVFVHVSAVERAGLSGLKEHQKVTFQVGSERKVTRIFDLVQKFIPKPN